MRLKSVELSNFRNFRSGQFEFSSGVNVFFGPNASGKTNLLEAVHVLSNLRSFRTRIFKELINWDEVEGYVRGSVQPGNEKTRSVSKLKALAVSMKSNTRIPFINSKQCRSSKDYLQIFPSATFVPDDLDLVKGAPTSRRYFLDKGTFLFHPPYWGFLADYNRLLRQKNALLRELQRKGHRGIKDNPCDIWDIQLQALGSQIIVRRVQFIHNLQRLLKSVYTEWSGTRETITLQYKSSIGLREEHLSALSGSGNSEEESIYQSTTELYGRAIQHNQGREYRLGTTVIGPHRDDIDITLAGRPLRSYGSQGQQRTAVLALKLAEAYLYFEQYGEYPVLLLDDVTSELDVYRNKGLFECLHQGMQVIVSATNKLSFPSFHSLPVEYFDLSKNNTDG